jgi:uncharacterized membrane protein
MQVSNKEELMLKAAGLGAMTGVRSISGLAQLVRYGKKHPDKFRGNFAWMTSEPTRGLVPLLALGEMAADKLPFIPNRTSLLPLLARIGWGAVVGAALYSSQREEPLEGAIVGGAVAGVSTFVVFYLRQGINKGLRIPNPLVGLLEDVAIVTAGPRLLPD